jgi:hypothetical protein
MRFCVVAVLDESQRLRGRTIASKSTSLILVTHERPGYLRYYSGCGHASRSLLLNPRATAATVRDG